MNRIGIIGAAGVAATNKLCTLVEEEVTRLGAYRDAHHPDMVIVQCTQVPSRSLFLEGRGESFIPDYIDIGKALRMFGCREIAMCCNTAHYAIDELSDKVGLPFVNVLELVAQKVNERGVKHAGIICGDGCRKVNLYDKAFAKCAPNVKISYPDEEYQKIVTKGICGAKAKLRFTDKTMESGHPYNCFKSVCNHLKSQGVDVVVGGCTDICNVFDGQKVLAGEYVDSLKVMAEYVIKHYSNYA